MVYTYDGSFFGYLSAVFDAWHDGLGQTEEIRCDEEEDLFGQTQAVATDMGKAKRLLDGLTAQCGSTFAHFLYYAFLAEQPRREMKLLAYLQRAFYYKASFKDHLSERDVWTVRQWARKTGNERHKLLGLARFRELTDGTLYCPLSPTCCVVPVMAPHFIRRFPGETWILHDRKRHMGVYYDGREASVVEIPRVLPKVQISEREEGVSSLWKKYYDTIAIAVRRNEGLRRQFMPKKYWGDIIEMEKER